MLKAKAKDDCRYAPVVSCSGVMFAKDIYTRVPQGFEEEALANPYLDVEEMDDRVEVVAVEDVEPDEPAVEPSIPDVVVEPEAKEEFAATPGAKELASQMHIKLSWLTGTGKDGKIVQKDVEDYLAQKAVKKESAKAKE